MYWKFDPFKGSLYLTGDMDGPASSTDNTLVRFDGTSGKRAQGSGIVVDDSNNISGIGTLASGAITATTGAFSGAVTIGGTLGVTDDVTAASSMYVNGAVLQVANKLRVSDGTILLPSISWTTDTDTGFFLNSANSVGFVAGGVFVGQWSALGKFTLGASGGVQVHDIEGGLNVTKALAVADTATFASSIVCNGNILAGPGTRIDVSTALDTLSIGTVNAAIINIGTGGTTQNINIGGAGDTVYIAGTLAWVDVTDLKVTDKIITLNKGGAAASGNASGIEVEENSVATGYVKVGNSRSSWEFLAPAAAGTIRLTPGSAAFSSEIISTASADRQWTLPNVSDTFVGVAATQTLTSKTLTSPAINTPTIIGGTIASTPISGASGSFTTLASSELATLNSVSITTTLGVTGALTGTSASFSTTLGVTGAATLSSTLLVSDTATFSSSIVANSVLTVAGQFRAAAGSAGTPSIAFSGDTNTGLFSKAADSVGFAAAGAEVGSWSSAGAFNIGPVSFTGVQTLNGDLGLVNSAALRSPGFAVAQASVTRIGMYYDHANTRPHLYSLSQPLHFSVDGAAASAGSIETSRAWRFGGSSIGDAYHWFRGAAVITNTDSGSSGSLGSTDFIFLGTNNYYDNVGNFRAISGNTGYSILELARRSAATNPIMTLMFNTTTQTGGANLARSGEAQPLIVYGNGNTDFGGGISTDYLGSSHRIKWKVLSGTASAATTTNVAHGLTSTNIISVTGIWSYSSSYSGTNYEITGGGAVAVANDVRFGTGSTTRELFDSTNVYIHNTGVIAYYRLLIKYI